MNVQLIERPATDAAQHDVVNVLRALAMDLRAALVWGLALGLWLALLGRSELRFGEPAPSAQSRRAACA